MSPRLLVSAAALLALARWADADTPDSIADPEALPQSIPRLLEQRVWTDDATPEEVRAFDGPQTVWPVVPESDYDLSGFDASSLGSKVPPPGVHPRVLFSPDDVPGIAARLKASISGRRALLETRYALDRTLWNPKSDEGKIFAKLSSGDPGGLEWPDGEGQSLNLGNKHFFKGYTQSMKASDHEGYLPHLMASAAFLCLLDDDSVRGKQVAAAFANYYKLRELLSLLALARRGDNLFGHPHLRRLTTAQTQAVVPAGGWNVNQKFQARHRREAA